MLPLLICVWAFVKEIFFGERLKDPYKTKAPGDEKKKSTAARIATGTIDRMQRSRAFLASIALLLVLSLFINYKMIIKLTTVVRKDNDEEQMIVQPIQEAPVKRPDDPQPQDPEVLGAQALSYLEKLYGVKK